MYTVKWNVVRLHSLIRLQLPRRAHSTGLRRRFCFNTNNQRSDTKTVKKVLVGQTNDKLKTGCTPSLQRPSIQVLGKQTISHHGMIFDQSRDVF